MKKNIMWNTFGSVFYSMCQWLITIVVVWVADYEAAGVLSLAMSTSSSFSAISLFSMRNYQVSDVKCEYRTNEYVGSRILTCIVAFVSCSIYVGFTASKYQIACIVAFMMVRVAEAIVDVLHGVNQKYNRYDLIGKSYILRGIATILFFTLLLGVLDNMMATLWCVAMVNFLIALLYDWKWTNYLEKVSPKIFNRQVLSLLKRCTPIVIFSFLLSLENLIPKNILQELEGTTELGIYASIASPTLVVQVFSSVVFNPFLPQFSVLYNEKKYKDFRKMLHKVYVALFGLCMIVNIGAMMFGKLGLCVLYTQEILKHYNLFMPIVWCTILIATIWILSAIIIAIRQIKWLLMGILVDFGLCMLLVRPCIEKFGKNGISIVQIVCYVVYILFMIGVCEVTVIRDEKEMSRN